MFQYNKPMEKPELNNKCETSFKDKNACKNMSQLFQDKIGFIKIPWAETSFHVELMLNF